MVIESVRAPKQTDRVDRAHEVEDPVSLCRKGAVEGLGRDRVLGEAGRSRGGVERGREVPPVASSTPRLPLTTSYLLEPEGGQSIRAWAGREIL